MLKKCLSIAVASLVMVACGDGDGDDGAPGAGLLGEFPQRSSLLVPGDTLIFLSAGDIYSHDPLDVQIMGGRPADPTEYPASFFLDPQRDGSPCSSTLVGPRVVLTAAHCVLDEGVIGLAMARDTVLAVCSRHPDYDPRVRQDRDWALCLLDAAMQRVTSVESVHPLASFVDSLRTLQLSGFGCANESGEGIGVFRIGTASIQGRITGSDFLRTEGPVALCFGDSGGAGFAETATAHRYQVSVNVIADLARRESYVATLSSPSFLQFARRWRADNGVLICGLDNHPLCRSPAPHLGEVSDAPGPGGS